MLNLLVYILINGIGVYVTCSFVPGLHIRKGMEGFWDALLGGLILSIMNWTVKPLLMLLTLPINILTLGLFTFVILGFTFWLMTLFAPGIHADGFGAAILGAIVFTIINWLMHLITDTPDATHHHV